MTIADFLLARIAEDEAIARAAATREGAERWRWYDNQTDAELTPAAAEYFLGDDVDEFRVSLRSIADFPSSVGSLPVFVIGYAEEVPAATGAYMTRFDAARVLAECQAKRAVVEEFAEVVRDGGDGDYRLERVFRHLAAVYADHPDYEPEWRP